MERKRIIAAFGDIRGFRKWILRANNSPENAGDLMEAIYLLFEDFTRRSGAYVKFMGDGFLAIIELRTGHNCGVARELLGDMHQLTADVVNLMKPVYPRPDGFRVRVAAGHVWKRMTLKKLHGKILRHPEYIGYAVNMAQSLLYVYPEIECICHESIIELIGPKKHGLLFTRLAPPKERRHGVDPQDFEGLWSFGPEKPVGKSS